MARAEADDGARPSAGGLNDPLRSIDWGTQLATKRVDVYFAPEGAVVGGETSLGWTGYEIRQAWAALDRIAEVVDLTFRETNSRIGAEFRLTTGRIEGATAWMNPPGEWLPGLAVFDPTEARLGDPERDGVLEPGSFGFTVMLHEFGHGLGLAHLHDDGGTSTVWQGVEAPFGDYGRALLNQGVYSAMTYNDGWPAGPLGLPDSDLYGLGASMMALDIAVLQSKYGANAGHATGDDVYLLPGSNGRGTSYTCIWDAGGSDVIEGGSGGCVIDLRAASLQGEPGGGGWISHATGIHGGFTIANGVEIEAAQGGSGDDVLRGNFVANRLSGRQGDDLLAGGIGDDGLRGGRGADDLRGGAGDDLLVGRSGRDMLDGDDGADRFQFRSGDGRDRIIDFEDGSDLIRIRSGADRFSDLALRADGDDAVLRFADVRVTLEDLPLAALDRDDFLFA